jgi:hypothetical protein
MHVYMVDYLPGIQVYGGKLETVSASVEIF